MGRFQPFHLGHLHAVRYALSLVEELLIGVGSSNICGEPDNPYPARLRQDMIRGSLPQETERRCTIHLIPDVRNHVKWMDLIRKTLPPFGTIFTNDVVTRRLYARSGIRVCGIPFLDRPSLSGTAIRARMAAGRRWDHLVPPGTLAALGASNYK